MGMRKGGKWLHARAAGITTVTISSSHFLSRKQGALIFLAEHMSDHFPKALPAAPRDDPSSSEKKHIKPILIATTEFLFKQVLLLVVHMSKIAVNHYLK